MSSTSIYPEPKKPAHNAKTYEQYKNEIEDIHKESKYIVNGVVGDWKGDKTKVIVTCPIHGKWQTGTINKLKNGRGCPECGYMASHGKLFEEAKNNFISKANVIHENKYDYSLTEYINSQTKVKIICSTHGVFEILPRSHLGGYGCTECGHNKRTADMTAIAAQTFIQKAQLIHDNKYNYDKVVYTKSSKPVIMTCPDHGDFSQRAHNHLQGQGCPACSKHGYQIDKFGYIYLLIIKNDNNESFTGYGITNKLGNRIQDHKRSLRAAGYMIDSCHAYRFEDGEWVLDIESQIKKIFPRIPNINIAGFKTENSTIENHIKINDFIESRTGWKPCLLISDFKLLE